MKFVNHIGLLSGVSTAFVLSAAAGGALAAEPARLSLSPQARQQAFLYLDQVEKKLSALTAGEAALYFSWRDAKGNHYGPALSAPSKEYDQWELKDPARDGYEGTSTERAYRELNLGAPATPVVVAVIDSGFDLNHEDLRGRWWVNEAEAGGQTGVDDDGNGYVDDVNGWNFLGNPDGRNVEGCNLEVAREFDRIMRKKARLGLTAEEEAYLDQIRANYLTSMKKRREYFEDLHMKIGEIETAVGILRQVGLEEETTAAVEAIESKDPVVLKAKSVALSYLKSGWTTAKLKQTLQEEYAKQDIHSNPGFNPSDIIGDDPNKLDEVGYGNNDLYVSASSAHHGTHVSGTIAANRGNSLGVKGHAEHARIMALRAVPDGDERDKDVANAVRYAVDNGARIINMSFGKAFSPQKAYVDEAFRYAEEKGVLVVHAAGNDGSNNDLSPRYPNRIAENGNWFSNWFDVGASNQKKGESLPAFFSNYGKKTVDLFAPGMGIYSTTPGSKYGTAMGTSMASPQVAGVAALVLSQNPELSAEELRAILRGSVGTYSGLAVRVPNGWTPSPDKVLFESLSMTGGILNAYNALTSVLR